MYFLVIISISIHSIYIFKYFFRYWYVKKLHVKLGCLCNQRKKF